MFGSSLPPVFCKRAHVLGSNIPAAPAYGVYISQMIRYSRACGSYQDILDRGLLLTRKLLNQGFLEYRIIWEIYTPYAGAAGMLLPLNGKFILWKDKNPAFYFFFHFLLKISTINHFENCAVTTLTRLTVIEYLCHKWPKICSTCRKHFPVLSSFMTCNIGK
jgi:hypothetical protein